jgi:hypothetical protein
MKKSTILWVIVTIIGAVAAVTIAGIAFGLDEKTTPIVVTVLGIAASVLPSVLALIKVDQVHTEVTNGNMERKILAGAEKAIENKEVLTRDGPVVSTQLAAIQHLLETREAKDIRRDESNGGQGV